ncbi:beta-lactamase-like protein [Sporodiniella umbellata]|nr:beta-lactamase-like protein [Sporodiniella umbellata]
MKIIPVRALENNYSYILIDEKSKEAAVIDPVEPNKILNIISQTGTRLKSVFTTHHHWDHAGGNIEMLAKKPGLAVYGADARIPEINYVCKDLEDFKLGSLDITPLHTPCHTKGHVCYYVQDKVTQEKAVFTGDTLFVGGIGNFHEGDARDMYRNLFHSIVKLPDETWVYCGHESTVSNLKFALSVEPGNKILVEKWNWIQGKSVTVPSTIGQEKLFNPYLRVNERSLQLAVGKSDPVEVLHALREMQNTFC